LGESKEPHSLDTLLRVLDTRNLELRAAAIHALHELGAVKVLQSRLTDFKQPASARRAAAQGLRFLEDASAVPALLAALEDPSAEVRAEAALALSVFNPAAAQEPLLTALNDPSEEVRYYAAVALGAVPRFAPTPRVKSALLARQSMEKDPTVLYSLSVALRKLASTEPKVP
jgi:HEAT repeat protein